MARTSKASRKTVGSALHRQKRGKLTIGKKGPKVKSRKQAIAIGLSEARKKGEKAPPRSRKKTAGSRRKKVSSSRRAGGQKKRKAS